jgi:positive regulator of sigma E activity
LRKAFLLFVFCIFCVHLRPFCNLDIAKPMEKLVHLGIVDAISGKSMRVRIEQSASCSGCHASQACSAADKQEKCIDIPVFSGSFQLGQAVLVEGESSFGLKAVFFAYMLPLILMMAALALSTLWLFPRKEGVGALISLATVLLYYLALSPFRQYLRTRFVFTVKPLDDSLEA